MGRVFESLWERFLGSYDSIEGREGGSGTRFSSQFRLNVNLFDLIVPILVWFGRPLPPAHER